MAAVLPPRIKHLNWNLLRTFLVIVEERSITRAAERLHLRQPAVTSALQKLEDTLGTQLIRRDSRRFVLTGAGEALRQECVEILRRVERIGERLSPGEGGLTGQVRITVVTQVHLPALDRTLALMGLQHPGVSLRIDVANSQEIAKAVAQRTLPFGLCLLPKPLIALECRFIMREEFGIYCGATHGLFGRADASLDELRQEAFVAFTCGQDGRGLEPMAVLRDSAGLGDRTAGMSSTLDEVQRMITSGIGIGLLPCHTTERAVAEGGLWHLPVLGYRLGADLYLITNPDAHLEPEEDAFLSIFSDLAFPALERAAPRLQ